MAAPLFRTLFDRSHLMFRVVSQRCVQHHRKYVASFPIQTIFHSKKAIQRTLRYTSPPLLAIFGFSKSDNKTDTNEIPVKSDKNDIKTIIEKADQLFDANSLSVLYDLLISHKNDDNPELLWRLGRAAYSKSQELGRGKEGDQLMRDALSYVAKALSLNENISAVHKWYAILLDVVGELDGTKARITNSFIVRDHFKKSIELEPTNATSIYSLGLWCFLFADMPWYTRKVASVIFASPPTSTYEEALSYFKKAEEVSPNFYSKNLMMLGKTHMRLGNKEKAVEFLLRAKGYKVVTEDDKAAHQEAVKLLKDLGQ